MVSRDRTKKNRNQYDTIYEILTYCRDREGSQNFPCTKTRIFSIFGGNYSKFEEFFTNSLLAPKLIVIDTLMADYYNGNTDVYRITADNGREYIRLYEELTGLLIKK